MAWYRFWAKHDGDVSTKKEKLDMQLLDADFFCQLCYMASIATSGISRSGLFDYAAKLPYIASSYFRRAVFVAKAFNHDYAEACRIVGQATKEPEVKAFLLRFSGALSSGEDITGFLSREASVSSDAYGNHYDRRLETLRKWTDAYVALIMTTAIITVMAVVTMIIGTITTMFVISLAVITILVTVSGVYLIYRTAPREIKSHALSIRSREQIVERYVVKVTIPAVVVWVVVAMVAGVDLGWVTIVAGAALMPLGLIAMSDDSKVDKRDSDIAGFLRSLGGVSQAIGATVTEAMGRLDFRSLGYLREGVSLLYTRLLAGIEPKLCWAQFVGETGSEQVNRAVRIFQDGIALGGEPQTVGDEASAFAMQVALLRAKRKLIDSGILYLTIIMHVILTALVVFVYQILISFSLLIEKVMPGGTGADQIAAAGMPSFGVYGSESPEMNLMFAMVIAIVYVLSFANAMAIYATSGGHFFKLAFYLSLTLVATGASLAFVPPFVSVLFAGMT